MKRILPPTSDIYPGPEEVERTTVMPGSKEFALWATAFCRDGPIVVRIVRERTIERDATKVVLFGILPQGVLIDGRHFYAAGLVGYPVPRVSCSWSDFLLLTRWRKALASRSPEEQARIAHLTLVDDPPQTAGYWILKAVDDPIRYQATL